MLSVNRAHPMSTSVSISLYNRDNEEFDFATPYNIIVCGNETIGQPGLAIQMEKLMFDDEGD